MRLTLLFLIVIVFNTAYSQNYAATDSVVSKYSTSFRKPSILADLIMKDFKSDEDRVRAIYSWVVYNVNYSLEESGRYSYTYQDEEERLVKEKKYQNRLASRVISKNVAVCEGYSILFKQLCNLMEIKCRLVTGFAKSEPGLIGRYASNHSWNIIEINSQNFLVDATWGRGEGPNSKERYFMTNPIYFINDHFPDDYKYSLLPEIVDKKKYANWPLVYESEYSVFDIVKPQIGILKIDPSKTKNISFKFKWNSDKVVINYFMNQGFFEVSEYTYTDGMISFNVPLEPTRARELLIYMNDQPFLAYKLRR